MSDRVDWRSRYSIRKGGSAIYTKKLVAGKNGLKETSGYIEGGIGLGVAVDSLSLGVQLTKNGEVLVLARHHIREMVICVHTKSCDCYSYGAVTARLWRHLLVRRGRG